MIVRESQVVRLQPAQCLFMRGDEPDGLYAVIEGAVEIGAMDEDGETATLTVAQTAMWFGEIAVVDDLSRTHTATAIEQSTLLRIPQAQLLEFLARHPQNWRDVALLLTEKLRLAFTAFEDAARLPAHQRIAARIVMIAEGYGGASSPQNDIRLSQAQFASMLSMSRQTVNQVLKAFEAAGLIALRQAHVVVVDLDALKRVRAYGLS